MPKRPCALALTADNRTILSADKFGDVYALPLIPSNSPSTSPLPPQNLNRSRSSLTPTPSPGTAAALKPQANELTVHTKRNLIALENQKKSLSRKSAEQQSQSSGATPSFEHALLLGHVSMLTAICVATLTTTTTTTTTTTSISLSNDGQQQPQQQPETQTPTTTKEYILTADRDEHIRVSRGMPQSHVIEGFCLGHDEFVSRLCVAPGGREGVLISGGGDDDLFVWDWPAGRLLCRAGLAGHVKDAMVLVPSGGDRGDGNGNGDGRGGKQQVKVAVTKLLASRWTGCETVVFVACERYVWFLLLLAWLLLLQVVRRMSES
jgi:tRNA (guanine-N(7)-)-methyltransferase subunit TRM82